jgi:hypothetical protein
VTEAKRQLDEAEAKQRLPEEETTEAKRLAAEAAKS